MKKKNILMSLCLLLCPLAVLQAAFFQDCQEVTSALDEAVIKLAAATSVLDRVAQLDDVSISKLCQTDSQLEVINSVLAIPLACNMTTVISIESSLEQTESAVDVIASAAEELALLIDDALLTATTCKGIPIDTAMVSPSGFTITTSGRYYLKESISFASTGTEIAAITIDADQVILNLNGYTLRNTGGIGVEVLGSHKQVIIENGFIGDNGSQGIKLGVSVEYITLRRLNIFSTTSFGIWFTTAPTSYITLENIVFNTLSNHAISFSANNATHQNIFLRNIVSLGGSGRIDMRGTQNVFLKKCVLGSVSGNAFLMTNGSGSSFSQRLVIEDSTCFACGRGFYSNDITGGGVVFKNNTCVGVSTEGIRLGGFGTNRYVHCIDNTCINNNYGILTADSIRGNYIGDNTTQYNTTFNIAESGSSQKNSVVGNYAYNASGNNFSGSSMNKNVVALRNSSFLDVPTRWYNVDGRNS